MWKRAGQTALITGLDYSDIAPLLPAGGDAERILAYLGRWEIGMLVGQDQDMKSAEANRKAQAEMEQRPRGG